MNWSFTIHSGSTCNGKGQNLIQLIFSSFIYDQIMGLYSIHADVLEISGEPFVQPNRVPPFGRHQITKPLMGQFMGIDRSHVLILNPACGGFINQ